MRLTNYNHNDFVIRKNSNIADHVLQEMPVSVGTSCTIVICIFSGNVRQSHTASNKYLGWWPVNEASDSMRVHVEMKMCSLN